MSEMRKYSNGRWYSCRPWRGGIYYIFWSEVRRSKRQSTGTANAAEAQAFLDEWLSAESGEAPGRVMLCEDLYRFKYPEGAYVRADSAWQHLGPFFGHLRPIDVTDALEARYIAQRGCARSTIRTELSYLRASWNMAVKKRILSIDDTPALGPLPPASPPRDRWLRPEETKRLITAAREYGRRPYLFLWLALETAARRGAILDLRWSQVDWETGVIHYLRPGAEQTSKRKASVPISKALRPVLVEAHATRGSDPYVIGAGGKVNDAIHSIATRAGVERVTPHVLRHTAATHMARRGVPLWLIAKVLGNSVEQVEKVYAKHSPEMLQSAVDAISG